MNINVIDTAVNNARLKLRNANQVTSNEKINEIAIAVIFEYNHE